MGNDFTFEEFCDYVKDNIAKNYLFDCPITSVDVRDVDKNNAVTLKGLCIKDERSNLTPTIYLDYAYSRYINGEPLNDIMYGIADDYRNIMQSQSHNIDINAFLNPSVENVIPRLVNYKKNKDMLRDCPYVMFQDLAVTFRLFDPKSLGRDGFASVTINNAMFEDKFDLTVSELYDKALDNYSKLFPTKIGSILDELAGGFGVDPRDLPPELAPPFYVITNEYNVGGSANILLDGTKEEMGEILNENYYLVPSSIHEFLAMPDSFVGDDVNLIDELVSLTRDVNASMVSDQDFLSNTIYHYDIKTKTLSMVNNPDDPLRGGDTRVRVKYNDDEAKKPDDNSVSMYGIKGLEDLKDVYTNEPSKPKANEPSKPKGKAR